MPVKDVDVPRGVLLLGKPVCAMLPDTSCRDMGILKDIWNRSKSKKPKYSTWVTYFLEQPLRRMSSLTVAMTTIEETQSLDFLGNGHS